MRGGGLLGTLVRLLGLGASSFGGRNQDLGAERGCWSVPPRWERGGGGAKPNNGRENPKSLRLAARLLAGARGAACRRSRVYVAGAGGE